MSRAVSQLLLDEWSQGLRLTTVPQALSRLGLDVDPQMRWSIVREVEPRWRKAFTRPEKRERIEQAIGRRLDNDALDGLRRQVDEWSIASIALSDDEKLIARYLLLRRRQRWRLPTAAEIATALATDATQVERGLWMLNRVGLIADGGGAVGYHLVKGHEALLRGLGFSFHTVTLDTGEQFGVP